MDTIKTILVVIDPTVDRDFVVERAKIIAKKADASVEFFINNSNTMTEHSYIYEGVDGAFFETQRKLFEDHYQKLLSELVDEFRANGMHACSSFTEEHHLAEAIIERVKQSNPDLVLKSTHHHSVIERSLISNTDWRLIRKCPAPLLLVKPRPWIDDGNIMTAVDPLHNKAEQSSLDHSLLKNCISVAKLLNLQPHVFHSYFPFINTMFPVGSESKVEMESIRQKHADKLSTLLEAYTFSEDNVHMSQGDLVPSLIKRLEAIDANILVIGALSRNALERAIVGNTAEKILEDCPCDTLIIKPENK